MRTDLEECSGLDSVVPHSQNTWESVSSVPKAASSMQPAAHHTSVHHDSAGPRPDEISFSWCQSL